MSARTPALDGLRGVAILLVVAGHMRILGLPRAQLGVDLFFVLSGFLITGLLLDSRYTLRGFYTRRARRILPAFIVWLPVAILLRANWITALFAVTFTTDLAPHFGRHGVPGAGLWSLAMEEQFYLVWPLVLPVILKWRRPGLLVAAAAVAFYGFRYGHGTMVTLRFDSLLIGCAAQFAARAGMVRSWFAAVAVPAALMLWLAPLQTFAFSILAAFLLLACLTVGPAARLLSWSPLRFFGRVSYALYLWHLTIYELTRNWLVAAPLSVGVSWLSWIFIEQRWLQRRESVVGQTAFAG